MENIGAASGRSDTNGARSTVKRKRPADFDAAATTQHRASLDIVKSLSLLEQKVVRFVFNAQKTVASLATLPAATGDDEDDSSKLEELVHEQMDILSVLQAELPKNVLVLGNYRATSADCYETELTVRDAQNQVKLLRKTVDAVRKETGGSAATF